MRKALLTVTPPHASREEAEDNLFGLRLLVEDAGMEAAWICGENCVHFICTKVTGLDALTPETTPRGQRIVWVGDAPLVTRPPEDEETQDEEPAAA